MLHCVSGVEFPSQMLTVGVSILSSEMADERRYRYKAQPELYPSQSQLTSTQILCFVLFLPVDPGSLYTLITYAKFCSTSNKS